MDNLINRQVAIDELSHGIYEFFDICEDDDESPMTYNDEKLLELINKCIEKKLMTLPAVDAVPVIRCKDCKYMTEHYDTDGNVPYWTCSEWDSGTDYDGFCHYAERRTNET